MASIYNYDLMHHHHQQIPQTAISQYPQFSSTEWLQGWRRWAESRKRGKMAQFIVELLEKGASGRWLDITAGKFELTEWHAIAQFWYKKKKRASDPTDAPCMLRKGLPRAFPNLREVKSDSVKDGTQYKSRVFQCPPELVQGTYVHIYIISIHMCDICMHANCLRNLNYNKLTVHYLKTRRS